MSSRPLVVLFAKAPVATKVKTRLGLAPERALRVHELLVEDVWGRLKALQPQADVMLYTDEPTSSWPAIEPRGLQGAGDLGDRMARVVAQSLADRRPQAMIVGGDIPDLPAEHLEAMLASTADITLGPTDDGGYWGIACRRYHPEMFAAVAWSTDQAFAHTQAACERCGLTVASGPRWHDLDTPEDIPKLSDSLRQRLGL